MKMKRSRESARHLAASKMTLDTFFEAQACSSCPRPTSES